MMVRTLSVVFAVLALAMFVSQPAVAAEKIHEGQIVKVGDSKLTFADKDGANRQTLDVAADAKIHCDGKECKLDELKEGCTVKVTTNTDDKGKTWATKIEAKAKI